MTFPLLGMGCRMDVVSFHLLGIATRSRDVFPILAPAGLKTGTNPVRLPHRSTRTVLCDVMNRVTRRAAEPSIPCWGWSDPAPPQGGQVSNPTTAAFATAAVLSPSGPAPLPMDSSPEGDSST